MYNYKAKVLRVIDGDTIIVDIDLGFHIKYKAWLRLKDINTPEIYGKEKQQGLRIKKKLEDLINNQEIEIQSHGKGKYGRVLCDVFFEKKNIKIHLTEWMNEMQND